MFEHYYHYNRSCSWLITVPIGQRVLIYFTRFELRNCYLCDCNSVTITDGRQSWSPRLARFCGKDLPRPVYSSGRHIRITFHPEDSDYFYHGGFQLQYSTLFHHLSSKFFLIKIQFWLPKDRLIFSFYCKKDPTFSWRLWNCCFLLLVVSFQFDNMIRAFLYNSRKFGRSYLVYI